MRYLLALLVALSATAHAGPWGLDVGLAAGIGMTRFSGEPSGADGAFSFLAPEVKASGGTGLAGQAGFELALHRKRRFMASLQVLWQGQSLGIDETLTFPSSTTLDRSLLWEWSGLLLPLELSYGIPLASAPTWALMGRAGVGAWYQKNQAWRKHLSSGASRLERPWNGPPDDWGPLLGLGLDWLALPSGKRVCSFEVRAMQGTTLLDADGGADRSAWTLGAVLSVPVAMWVL